MKPTIPPEALRSAPSNDSTDSSLVVWLQGAIATYPLQGGAVYSIGRASSNEIVVPDDAVSRCHAVVYGGRHPELEDLRSRNGTSVDGQKVEPGRRIALNFGAAVRIGPATLFVHNGSPASHSEHDLPWQGALPAAATDVGGGLVVRDERMLRLYQNVEAVAAGDISVLILGETGVGKELMAHAIHAMSGRRSHPFVKFNSAALPEQLVESELFGHERGAFTGADKAKAGLFETADNGTLFLDEVGDLSLAAQAKLLRVLETGDILRVGSVKPRKVTVRFISATNRDLRNLIAAGTFRKDLYYRLNGVSVRIPPLRERPNDIPPLVDFFGARAARQPGVRAPVFTAEAIVRLTNYRWPGNVRELRNVVERAALLARGAPIGADELQIDAQDGQSVGSMAAAPRIAIAAPAAVNTGEFGDEPVTRVMTVDKDGELVSKLRSELAKQERTRILEALSRANGNQTVAAELLGVSRRTLLTRLDTYAIPRPRKGRLPDE